MIKIRLSFLVERVTYAENHAWMWRPRPCWICHRRTHWYEVNFAAPTHRGRCTRDATRDWSAADMAAAAAIDVTDPQATGTSWPCPNDPQCPHPLVDHDIQIPGDQLLGCWADGCDCGSLPATEKDDEKEDDKIEKIEN